MKCGKDDALDQRDDQLDCRISYIKEDYTHCATYQKLPTGKRDLCRERIFHCRGSLMCVLLSRYFSLWNLEAI